MPSCATRFVTSIYHATAVLIMKDPMDENVTAGNIIADWPFTVFYHSMGHRGVLRSTRATHMRSYAPILGMAMRSVCHSVATSMKKGVRRR